MGLIGRDRELAEVEQRIDAGRRLVTIVGPGGIGKTSLGRAVVDRLAPGYPGGAHVVELTRIDRPEAVGGAVAAQLGFSSFDVLLSSPGTGPELVLVDNCEHVADGSAEAIGWMLDAHGALTVLATSRSPLALPGESIVTLGPLPVPPPRTVDPESGAVRLFCERARDSGAAVDDDQMEAVGELCRRLDGVPLTLEIAAARVRVLSPGEIVQRLDSGIDVLSRPRYRGAARHRSVRDTIEWSARLLDDGDRAAFARLAVCAGPFSLELASSVVGLPASEALDAIERLVDASMVDVDRAATDGRYRILEPIRAVAFDDLAGRGEVDEARERLAAHLSDVTAEMLAVSDLRWDADLLPTLLGRFDQIDAALRHSLANDSEPTRALLLYAVLWGVVHQARVDEVLELGSLLVRRWPDPSVQHGADAAATFAMGKLLCGHVTEARGIAAAALDHTEASTFAPVTLRRVLGLAARIGADHATAEALLAEAADAAAAHGIETMDLECQVYRAQDLAVLGRTEEALQIVRAVAERARDRTSILNEIWARSVEASVLATSAGTPSGHADVRPGGATAIAAEMLAMSRSIAYPFGVICNLQTLAACHLRAGELQEAAATAEQLLDAVARSGAGDLRRALDVAPAVLAAAGHPAAADLGPRPASSPTRTRWSSSSALGGTASRPAGSSTGRRPSSWPAAAWPELGADPTPDGASAAPEARPSRDEAAFVRSGDVWEVSFAGSTVHVRASKGMEELAVLLARPGREVHCLELAGAGVEEASTGEVIDATARHRYEERIRELQAEIDEADDHNDTGRAERAHTELDALVDELAGALGLGGRTRRSGGTAERARSAVTHRIRAAIRRIGEASPEPGRHLEVSVTTGTYCRYRPELPVRWRT